MNQALNQVLAAAAMTAEIKINDPVSIGQIGSLQSAYQLPVDTVSTIAMLRHERDSLSEPVAHEVMASAKELIQIISLAHSR